jgi:hypothetical protein
MTENSARAAGEQGSHIATVLRWRAMTHEIDAAVNLVKAAIPETHSNLSARHARQQQVAPRHHPVLSRGDRRDRPVGAPSEGFDTHTVLNPALD